MNDDDEPSKTSDLEKGLFGNSNISLEELVRLGEDSSLPSVLQPTPRPSIASVALVDDFSRTLYRIGTSLGEMQSMTDILGGPADSHDHRAKLNAQTDVVKEMIMRANLDLRRLGQQDNLNDVERVRLTKMTRDFQKLMKQFQEIQRKSLDKCREFVIRAQAIRDSGKTSPTPIADEAENAPLVSGNGQESKQTQEEMLGLTNEISYNQALIQEREQGIAEIETAMAEVHEIFCDLGLLVSDQQGLVDNIEANIESSAVRTRAAVRELITAREAQRRRRGNICFALILAFIFFVIAAAIINAIM